MSTQIFAHIPLAHITPSLTNPRKHFSAPALAELANSIAASGVHQPVLVRPLPGARVPDTDPCVQYELVAGERRYRASTMAGVSTIPAMVRTLTDAQVLEIQIVENLQRADLSELEEAEGFAALMQHNSLSADAVAAKIGKSRSQVYARLKLLDLCHEAQTALRNRQIDASRALLIARIPDSLLQIKALSYSTQLNGQGDAPSVRDFATWLKANVMLRLEHAPFGITDAHLVPAAGSCKDCPKRTGANPDLWADIDGADVCTDPHCYQSKTDAHRAKGVAQAEAKGMRFVDGKEALAIYDKYASDKLIGYSRLSQVREDCALGGTSAPKLRDLLVGKDRPELVLIEHPITKELIPAVRTADAEAWLVAQGLIKETGKRASAVDDVFDYKKDPQAQLLRISKQLDTCIELKLSADMFAALIPAIHGVQDQLSQLLLHPRFLREWLIWRLKEGHDDCVGLAEALEFEFEEDDQEKALLQRLRRCSNAEVYRAAAIVMVGDGSSEMRDVMMAHLEIDAKALAKKSAAPLRAEYAPQIAALKAEIEAQKAPPTTAPLAQPNLTRGQGPNPSRPAAQAKTKPSAAQPKMGAEEAKSGIAAAMQSMDRAATTPPEGQQGEDAQTAAPGDALLIIARGVVTVHKKASVRLLKTEMNIGAARAMDLMDKLETAGVVSAVGPTGAREVLVTE